MVIIAVETSGFERYSDVSLTEPEYEDAGEGGDGGPEGSGLPKWVMVTCTGTGPARRGPELGAEH